MLVSVIGRRNLFLFGVFVTPILTRVYEDVGTIFFGKFRANKLVGYVTYGVIMAIAIFVIWFSATDRLYFYTRYFRSTGVSIQSALFPEGAVNF